MSKYSLDSEVRNFAVRIAYVPNRESVIRQELRRVPEYERYPRQNKTPDASEGLTEITSGMSQLLAKIQGQSPVTQEAGSPIDGRDFVTVAVEPGQVKVTIADPDSTRRVVLTRATNIPQTTALVTRIEGILTISSSYVITDAVGKTPPRIARVENAHLLKAS